VSEHEGLDAFAAAYATRIDRDIVRAAPVPDIDDVWARVREIDESLLPADLDAAADYDEDDGVLPFARARAMHSTAEHDLAPFAAALRQRIEGDLQERGLTEIPARKLRLVRASTAVLALAAALVLVVLGGTAMMRGRMLGTNDGTSRIEGRMLADGAWIPRPERHASEGIAPAPRVDPEPAPAVVETPVPEPAPRVRPPKLDDDALLDDLEARAQAAWRAGDLEGAEKLLREVIRRSRRGVRVELAYGDLFAIARQRGGASAQVAIWREYLKRAPNGRFADDVQAGLCRHAPADDAADCWADYLQAHPQGAHAKEARRRDEGTPP
jgi:hypothetical protein